ncbi:MAG: hypothetical protein AB8G14_05265 [Ilumatobacter sp.]
MVVVVEVVVVEVVVVEVVVVEVVVELVVVLANVVSEAVGTESVSSLPAQLAMNAIHTITPPTARLRMLRVSHEHQLRSDSNRSFPARCSPGSPAT